MKKVRFVVDVEYQLPVHPTVPDGPFVQAFADALKLMAGKTYNMVTVHEVTVETAPLESDPPKKLAKAKSDA